MEVPRGWDAEVAAAGLAPLPWRKSSEFFTLVRSHAELAANDTAVDAVFAQRLCVDATHEFRYHYVLACICLLNRSTCLYAI